MCPGDWLTLAIGGMLAAISYPLLWHGGSAEKAVVRRDGAVVAELPLTISRRIAVEGAIGVTEIEVQPGRARVVSDPGPRQYWVRKGWLTQANAIAICAPSHLSLSLTGKMSSHDSLSY